MNTTQVVDTIEIDYVSNTPINHRKKYAQFFTPQRIASFMCGWLKNNLPKKKNLTVLEPAIGLGIFSRTLISQHKLKGSYVGFDIDSNVLDKAKKIFDSAKIDIIKQDYILSDWSKKYDCIVCNPPYFKFHDYDNTSLIKLTNEKTGACLNGFTNLYALFLIKSISQLEDNGCASYIIPSEFLNADYGREVKKQLLETKAITDIIVFDFEENVFDDALTTSCIILIKKKQNKTIKFHKVKNLTQLDCVEEYLLNDKNDGQLTFYEYSYDELLPEIKWRNYYDNLTLDNLTNLVTMREYCRVKRGIATGANEYFVFNLSKAKQYGISEANLIPCVSKSNDIKNLIFDKDNLQTLIQNDAFIFLVNLAVNNNSKVKEYVAFGEANKVNERFLTKNRNPWYLLENKKPADFWVGVFSRTDIRFIWNQAQILNLTTFHGVYVLPNQLNIREVIFAYLNTKIAAKIFQLNRREYGNGLNKFEPNDFNNSLIFDFSTLTSKEIFYIKSIVHDLSKGSIDENEKNWTTIENFFEAKIIIN